MAAAIVVSCETEETFRSHARRPAADSAVPPADGVSDEPQARAVVANGRGRLVAVRRQGVAARRARDRLSAGGRSGTQSHHRRRRGAGRPHAQERAHQRRAQSLRVADYPGGGTHRILFDFYARNQVPGASEDLHFNAAYRAREGERAAVRFYPIFVGLGVGAVGVAFHFHTVNVKTDADEAFLDFLDGDAFKAGLKLVTTAQPAIAPLPGMALALTKSIAGRNRNVSVQDCHLGLDFAGTAMGARLAVGDDIAVQIPETLQRVWDWQDWVYEPRAGLIVSRADPNALIPYNSVVFGVSRYEGE